MSAQSPRASSFGRFAGFEAERVNATRQPGNYVAAVRPSGVMTGTADAWRAIHTNPVLFKDLKDCAIARRDNPDAECKINQGDVDAAVATWIVSPAGQLATAEQARNRDSRLRRKQAQFPNWPQGRTTADACRIVGGNLRPAGSEFHDYCFHTPGSVGGKSAWAKIKTEGECKTGLPITVGGRSMPGVWRRATQQCASPTGYGKAAVARALRTAGLTAALPAGMAALPIAAPLAGNGMDGYGQWAPDQYDDRRYRRDYNDMSGQDYNDWAGQY
jgi:hypothetical protein